MSSILYLIPLGFIVLQLTVRDGYVRRDGLWQLHFSFAGCLWILCAIVGGSWVFFTFRCMIAHIYKSLRHGRRSSFVPVEDAAVKEEFLRVKKKLGIKRKINLYQNDQVTRPMIQGIFFSSVVLPRREYTREQLSVIFHHELMHYKSHDTFFKFCGACAGWTQHLNPISRRLLGFLDEWSEYHCDSRAIDAISDEMEAGRYFEVITDSLRGGPDMEDKDYIFSTLCESRFSLERRIEYMKRYKELKGVTKKATAAVVFAFAMTSVTTIYAAGSQLVGLHDTLYRNLEVTDGEVAQQRTLEEVYLSGAEDRSYSDIVSGETEERMTRSVGVNEMATFNWLVVPGTRTVTSSFYVKAGQSISISCTASPGNSPYWIGVQDGWNNVRYVEGSGSFGHTFSVESSGFYRVLVQNRGSVDIDTSGSYTIYE